MLTLDDARRLAATHAAPLDAVVLALGAARGHRLAEAVTADVDAPPGDVSAMDGYAARAADLDGTTARPIAGEIQAGAGSGPLAPGHVARIFTGAVLPGGADCVVPQERAEVRGDGVVLPETAPGACVRPRGEIFRSGETVLPSGTRLTPAAIALAAAAGAATVRARARPRIALVTSGGELVPAGTTPRGAEIRDSNTPMLAAFAAEAGLEVVETHHARDTRSALVAALERALVHADLVVTTGGVSVGDYDLVPVAVAALGGETILHGISMKPGKPTFLARVRERMLLGLPGNPVSALAGWRLIGRPLAEALAGDAHAFEETPLPVVAGEAFENPGSRLLLRPAEVRARGGRLSATPLTWRGSHDVRGVWRTNALVRLEPGVRHAASDGTCGCYPLPWPWTPPDGADA